MVVLLDAHNGLLTAVATVGLVALTIAVVVDANDQGDVAHRQASIMDQANAISVAVQRAFVNVGQVRIEKYFTVENGGRRAFWRFTPIFSNDGATPTRNLRVVTFAGVPAETITDKAGHTMMVGDATEHQALLSFFFPFGKPPDTYYPPNMSKDFAKNSIPAVIGPHGTQTISSVAVPEDLFIKSLRKNGDVTVSGEIRYNDTFPKTAAHVTEFCYLFSGDTVDVASFAPTASLCSYKNCADDDCPHDDLAEADAIDKMTINRAEEAARRAKSTKFGTVCLAPNGRCDTPPD